MEKQNVHRARLLDQWQSLRQGNMHVANYIDKFEEYRMCCNVREDHLVTFSIFKVGLCPQLISKLTEHGVHTLEQAYQVVQYSERNLTP